MLFTIFYMYATIMQWWRLRLLRDKLNGTLNKQNALIITVESNNIRQHSMKNRSLENLLFRYDDRIGCTVVPKQKLNLSHWLSFPKNLRYFPIFIEDNSIEINRNESIFILIQAIYDQYTKHQSETVQIENFGELIGWRLTDYFEIILKTNIDNLAKLVMKFSKIDLDINHDLQLLKIETVDTEGATTNIKYEKKYLKEQTLKYSYAPKHWEHFVGEIKDLYAKIRDSTNPKIKIENGTTKHSDISKTIKKYTLDVTNTDYRRHKVQNKTRTKDKPTSCSNKTMKKKEKIEINPSVSIPNDTKIEIELPLPQPKPPSPPPITITTTTTTTNDKQIEAESTNSKTDKDTDRDRVVVEDSKIDFTTIKPPNVLVYADSNITKENVKRVLSTILNPDTYTIYDLPTNTKIPWNSSTALVVVCGSVPPELTTNLTQYFLNGGQLFCLCSDLMYSILHTFTTAEVREHELVRFSYGNWQRVKMMHHIFCYQASPAKKQFSKDSDHSSGGSSPLATTTTTTTPTIVEFKFNDNSYKIQVKVLGTEETWHTPSLLLAKVQNTSTTTTSTSSSNKSNRGRAVFSQVHLEIDPEQYENDEIKYESLKSSNVARLEIFKDLLSRHFDMNCVDEMKNIEYLPGYFLGQYQLKMEMLSNCRHIINNQLNCDKINLVFCGKNTDPGQITASRLPVMIHACPSNFSTVEYFETLATQTIGRLVIYADIITSSQYVLTKKLHHGLVIIAKQQTNSYGRSNNVWLSPLGTAAFSLQLHIPLSTNLGQYLSLIQHIISTAIIVAIKKQPGYQDLNVGIKWPNDIYADGNIKIGGAIANTTIQGDQAIVNYGAGINLSNQKPTICLYDLIERQNRVKNSNLQLLSYECYFASVFNEIERLFLQIQQNGVDDFFNLYYQHWLHDNAKITIKIDDKEDRATIIGIDQYGYLRVRLNDGSLKTVQPDGNSFDMMRGLIIPKIF